MPQKNSITQIAPCDPDNSDVQFGSRWMHRKEEEIIYGRFSKLTEVKA